VMSRGRCRPIAARSSQSGGSGRPGQERDCRRYRTPGSRVLRPDAESDIFEAAIADGEVGGAGELLFPGQHRHVGIAEGEAIEDMVGRSDDVEKDVVAGAVEDRPHHHGRFDCDWPVGGSFQGQIERSVKRRGQRVDIMRRSGR